MLNHIYWVLYIKQTDTSIKLGYPKLQPFYASKGHQFPQLFYQTVMNF